MKVAARAVVAAACLTAIAAGQTPRPISERGLDNLRAFARMLGYVRYFHPSDASAGMAWERLAISSVGGVEAARDAAALASELRRVFRQAAPDAVVFPTGGAPPDVRPPQPGPYLVEWRHHGVGLSEDSPYYSARVTRPARGRSGELDLIRADLPGGVSCVVPRVLYTDKAGPFRMRPSAGTGAGSAAQRSVRLAAVILAWNVLQHFYPYFDEVRPDWAGALTSALRSAATDRGAVEFLSTLRRMIAALHDGHARVTMQDSAVMASPVGWDWVEGRLVLTDVSYAGDAPIERGDAVVAIDGKPVAEALRAAEAEISSATPQWLLARALGTGLHYGEPLGAVGEGSKDQPLVLEVESFRRGGVRTVVRVPRQAVRPVREARPAPITELEPGVMYVDVTRASDAGWRASLARLEGARGLILDLRGYPGNEIGAEFLRYLSEEPMRSPRMMVPIVTRPDHAAMEFERSGEWTLTPMKPCLKGRKVFLTDARAISFSETILGIVEEYRLGDIVGGPTAGTNGNINPFTVPGGYRITWSGLKVMKHDGSPHHGVGIAPTAAASRTQAGVAAGRDEVLERALQLLK
jgi:hypothetical protein